MGKCKKRTLNNRSNISLSTFMTRETAINNIFKMMENTRKQTSKKYSKKKSIFKDAISTISLFGISAEELSEAGVAYENLKALECVLS